MSKIFSIVPFYVTTDQKGDFSDDLNELKSKIDPDYFYMYKYKTAYCP